MLPEGVTLDTWLTEPALRWSFQHVDEILQTTTLPRGEGPVLALSEGSEARVPGLDELLDRTCTNGFLVLRGREIVVERYLNGLEPSSRHLLMSASKSLCGALVGRFVARGAIDVDAPVCLALPELAGTAYADATVRHVLDMTVGVAYDDALDEQLDRVTGYSPGHPGDPADTVAFLATLRPSSEHGRTFAYCTASSNVLGWLLERTTRRSFADLLADDLWSGIGAEHDAYVTVDPSGFPRVDAGVCVSLRDLARFGRVLLDDGVGIDGRELIPSAWVADIRRGGDPAAAEAFMQDLHVGGSYHSHFWFTGDDHGSFYAGGAFGQYLWMDPIADIVIAKLSCFPDAAESSEWAAQTAFFGALCRTLA